MNQLSGKTIKPYVLISMMWFMLASTMLPLLSQEKKNGAINYSTLNAPAANQYPDESDNSYRERMRKHYLRLTGGEANDATIRKIFLYPNLTGLNLSWGRLGGNGYNTLSKHPKIYYLDLTQSSINNSTITALNNMKSLRMLDLSRTRINNYGLDNLKNGYLTYLNLSESDVTAGSIPNIVSQFPRLKRLDLMGIVLNDDAMATLAGRKNIQELITELNASGDENGEDFFTDEELNAAIENKGLTDVNDLNLAATGITDRGLAILSLYTQLQMLNLSAANISKEGWPLLQRFKNLEVLSLNAAFFGDEQVEYIMALKNLKVLNLQNTTITDDGLEELADHENLRYIYLDGTSITKEGLAEFQKINNSCSLKHPLAENLETDG